MQGKKDAGAATPGFEPLRVSGVTKNRLFAAGDAAVVEAVNWKDVAGGKSVDTDGPFRIRWVNGSEVRKLNFELILKMKYRLRHNIHLKFSDENI